MMSSLLRYCAYAALAWIGLTAPTSPAHAQGFDPIFEDGFDCRAWYRDVDADTYGNAADFVVSCTPPAGYVYSSLDCNDNNPMINPAQPDTPDSGYLDTNCDGIDGNAATAFFVSTGGSSGNPGTAAAPFSTIAQGLGAAGAVTSTKKTVLVAGGAYNENLVLPNGVSLYGQYQAGTWARAAANTTSVTAQAGNVALTVSGYSGTGSVQGFVFTAGTTTLLAPSPRAIVLQNAQSGFSLRFNTIASVAGRNGSIGGNGTDGMPGGNGMPGLPGTSNGGSGGQGGPGGASICGAPGATGGLGGFDTGGGASGGMSVSGAGGGPGGPPGACNMGGSNNGGAGTSGSAGVAGLLGPGGGSGVISGANWLPNSGTSGTAGSAGGSGGGGGGGGGSSGNGICSADRGGGGGGGGAGGCGGSGGTGGGGGGGSIAILANASTAAITNNTIMTALGGTGGVGGNGGAGGALGASGPAGPSADDAGAGGVGGQGRMGGNGGCGGGGAGGISVGVLSTGSTLTLSVNTFALGNGGPGGAGGTTTTGGMCSAGANGASQQTLAVP